MEWLIAEVGSSTVDGSLDHSGKDDSPLLITLTYR